MFGLLNLTFFQRFCTEHFVTNLNCLVYSVTSVPLLNGIIIVVITYFLGENCKTIITFVKFWNTEHTFFILLALILKIYMEASKPK